MRAAIHRFWRGLAWVGLALTLSLKLPAAPPRQLSAPVTEKLGALRDLTNAKNYPAALALLEPLLASVPPESYDLAVLTQIKAQIILNQGGPTGPALAPLETALRLGDAHGYLDPAQTLEVLYLLAQLHYQQATTSQSPALQRAEFSAAATAIHRWLELSPRPGEDAYLLAALIFYNAATIGPGAAEPAALRTVRDTAAQGLAQRLQPKEALYLLVLDADQQLGETAAAADILELLVQRSPANREYWQQLAATDLALAAAARSTREINQFNLRALLTFERAQTHGFLNTPPDNFNVAGLDFNLGQTDRAFALLDSGLRTGAISDEPAHWELLAAAARPAHQETAALAALTVASAHHPNDGRINYAIGRLDYALDQHAPAREQLEAALAKGGLDQPGQAALLLAYLEIEARQFDAATHWLDFAARAPDAPTEEVARLRQALANASTHP